MAFTLRENPDAPEQSSTAAEAVAAEGFQVLAEPVVPELSAAGGGTENLPRVYGTQTLILMPRDPRSLFAYWDIDWSNIFAEERPRERRVALRLLSDDGDELARQDVEAFAGSCHIDVPEGGSAYRGEIGYFDDSDSWIAVAQSEPVTTPPDDMDDGDVTDFATVPFHLSFQRMIDMLRIAKRDSGSLTEMLQELREQVEAADESQPLSNEQREIASALEAAGAFEVPQNGTTPPDLWVQQKLERVLGFGGTSPAEGFGGLGGSSR
jgi:hypothetical protein